MQCWHCLYCDLKHLLQDWHCSILMYIFSFIILHHWNKQNATVSECHESLWFKQLLSPGIVVCTDYNTVLFSNIIQGNLLYKKKKKGCFLFFIFHSLQMQTTFQFKFIEVNPIQSFFFHCHEFWCSNRHINKKGEDTPAPIIHGICFCFSLYVTPAFINYKIIVVLPLPWKSFTCTAYRSSLTISWLSFY